METDAERIVVRWATGVPYCTDEECPQYDGKRCRLLGCRPCRVCEVEVQNMSDQLRIFQEWHAAGL